MNAYDELKALVLFVRSLFAEAVQDSKTLQQIAQDRETEPAQVDTEPVVPLEDV
jgi:hypothetical protein